MQKGVTCKRQRELLLFRGFTTEYLWHMYVSGEARCYTVIGIRY